MSSTFRRRRHTRHLLHRSTLTARYPHLKVLLGFLRHCSYRPLSLALSLSPVFCYGQIFLSHWDRSARSCYRKQSQLFHMAMQRAGIAPGLVVFAQ